MTDNIQYILNKENRYEHSWWRIVLIVLASIGFIIVFTFDTLSGTAASSMHSQMFGVSVESNRFSIDVYIQGTAAVSDKNPTQFTPAGQYSQHRKIVSMFFIRLDFFDLERYFSMASSMVNMALGQFVAGQFVADNSLRTIRRVDNSSQDNSSQDNSSHGQFVAWTIRRKTIRCTDYSSQ